MEYAMSDRDALLRAADIAEENGMPETAMAVMMLAVNVGVATLDDETQTIEQDAAYDG